MSGPRFQLWLIRQSFAMNIVYLNHAAYLGGAEVALLNLLADLDRQRYTPIVGCPSGALAEAVRGLQVRWIPIPPLNGLNRYNLPRFLWHLPQLAVAVGREAPDLIHANTNFAAQYAGLLRYWLRIPTVGHIRDIEPLGRMGRWVIRQNTRLIAISDAVTHYLQQEGMPRQQITKIYDGVDLRQYPARPLCEQSETDITPDYVIGMIGQIGSRKGHLVLLEAVRNLIVDFPNLRVWIVGQEPLHSQEHYTERLHAYVREHHLEHAVIFHGFRTDIPDILAQSDIVVAPSLQEPFGKVIIEGMAMQKPVVASSVGGIPEIVVPGETGVLVPPGDVEALTRALRNLLEHPEQLEIMGIAGRYRVEACFTSIRNARQTEQVYERLFEA